MVRFKNRYFAVEIRPKDRPEHAPFELAKSTVYHLILNHIQRFHGDFGVAAVANGLLAKYCNPYTKIALIRCRHGPHRFVATILPLITHVFKVPVNIRIIYVGATMSKCFKYITLYQQKALEKFWNRLRTDDDRLKMKQALFRLTEMRAH